MRLRVDSADRTSRRDARHSHYHVRPALRRDPDRGMTVAGRIAIVVAIAALLIVLVVQLGYWSGAIARPA